jgi:quercetin dioxygenase-like cupin family protein
MGLIRRRATGWRWAEVPVREYGNGAERQVLVGRDDGATQVELRYFEIPAGGASNHESHPHEHAIYILHGRARIVMGEDTAIAETGDAVFIPGNEEHQLTALDGAPLGFLCTAIADRTGPPT